MCLQDEDKNVHFGQYYTLLLYLTPNNRERGARNQHDRKNNCGNRTGDIRVLYITFRKDVEKIKRLGKKLVQAARKVGL